MAINCRAKQRCTSTVQYYKIIYKRNTKQNLCCVRSEQPPIGHHGYTGGARDGGGGRSLNITTGPPMLVFMLAGSSRLLFVSVLVIRSDVKRQHCEIWSI